MGVYGGGGDQRSAVLVPDLSTTIYNSTYNKQIETTQHPFHANTPQGHVVRIRTSTFARERRCGATIIIYCGIASPVRPTHLPRPAAPGAHPAPEMACCEYHKEGPPLKQVDTKQFLGQKMKVQWTSLSGRQSTFSGAVVGGGTPGTTLISRRRAVTAPPRPRPRPISELSCCGLPTVSKKSRESY